MFNLVIVLVWFLLSKNLHTFLNWLNYLMPHQQYRTTLCSIFSLTLTYIQVLTSTHTLTHTHTHACTHTHTLCICHYIYSVHDDWNKGKAERCTPNTPPSHKACLTMEMRKEKNVRPPCLPERRYKSVRQNPC